MAKDDIQRHDGADEVCQLHGELVADANECQHSPVH